MSGKNKSSKNSDDSPLDYIKINQKNIIEELTESDYIAITANLLKTFSIIEDNIGSEINKFFNILTPESKESDQLKLNLAISSKSKNDNPNLENYLNDILNRPELNYVVLNKELNEQLSTILKEVYKKLKIKKIKNYEHISEEAKKFMENNNYDDILKRYRVEKTKRMKTLADNDIILFNNSLHRSQNDFPVKESKSGKLLNKMKHQSLKGKLSTVDKNDNFYFYKFQKSKNDNNYALPVEMLLLIRKFSLVKKLKLVLNTENNNNEEGENNNSNIYNNMSNNINNNSSYINDSFLDKNDVQNTILIFLNFEWLFPNVVEIDVDLTCPELTDYLVNNIYSTNLKIFSRIFKKDIKLSIVPNNSKYNNRNYDPVQKFLFSGISNHIYDEEHSSDKFSTSMLSNNLNFSTSLGQINLPNNNSINQSMLNTTNNANTSFQSLENLNQKKLDIFLKKYSSYLEMIIIYGYFIQKKLSNAIKSKFILPLNLCDEILKLLRTHKVILENYHFFSFINNQNILHTTFDFNALDNHTFEKVLSFLNKNQLINNCNISFFPPEEYFKSQLLFKTLQNCDENFKININKYGVYGFNSKNIVKDIYPSEDINTYILRKLSKYFEKNLTDFFNLLTIKTRITDLSLFFEMPQILIKNGIYNNILIKFFMNLLIFINNSLNNITTLLISADNFIFDGRQHPILHEFFESLKFNDIKKEFKLLNFLFHAKIYNISNIHRLLSYELVVLSIGAFDKITFNSFVNFFSSSDFRQKSHLIRLKISLNNSVIDTNEVFADLIKIFTQFPKQIDEISFYSSLIISFEQIEEILALINYNKLIKVFMMFNIRSINKDKKLEELLESDLINIDKDTVINMADMTESHCIKRDKNTTDKIINLMMNLKKINPMFFKYNIYSHIERFLCHNDKKELIIQFKS